MPDVVRFGIDCFESQVAQRFNPSVVRVTGYRLSAREASTLKNHRDQTIGSPSGSAPGVTRDAEERLYECLQRKLVSSNLLSGKEEEMRYEVEPV